MRALSLLLAVMCSISLAAQQGGPPTITNQDILAGLQDGTKWLTYSGNYFGHRHSPLTQITPENVSQLKSSCPKVRYVRTDILPRYPNESAR